MYRRMLEQNRKKSAKHESKEKVNKKNHKQLLLLCSILSDVRSTEVTVWRNKIVCLNVCTYLDIHKA